MIADIQPVQMFRVTIDGQTKILTKAEVVEFHTSLAKIVAGGDDSSVRERIMFHVCEYFEVSRNDLLGRSRALHIAWPRHVATYLLRQHTSYSFETLGKYLGGRDHGTILNSCRRVMDMLATDKDLAVDVTVLNERICAQKPAE
jgi:chromosomal replication initiator protein